MRDDLTIAATAFASELLHQSRDDDAARAGVIVAATTLLAIFAIEEPEPDDAIDGIVDDMRDEAKLLARLAARDAAGPVR